MQFGLFLIAKQKQKLFYLPIQEDSVDLSESRKPSSTSWGIRIAEKPRTVPILRLAIPLTTAAATY